ncbi:uncharacterized protein LDX57_005202 [Aspergillus melleus]|uniref:uncharacterized protein n=1 Tax=Aspergillus melleus TaxID=138277 RepID=UPI001E8EBBA2|nr:uncharacterized protein LDX57_005202 [Aspergillus melleus]KAH8427489.1 hypothetical protein LDX57_005202 [Aspergillus melleus]
MTPAPPYSERPQPLPPVAPAPAPRTPGMTLYMLFLVLTQIATVVLLGVCVNALTGIHSMLKSGRAGVMIYRNYATPTPFASPVVVKIDTEDGRDPLFVTPLGTPTVRVQAEPEVDTGGKEVVEPPVETGVVETVVVEPTVEDVPPEETGNSLIR